ncbi:hypothetical protein LEAN103870_19620 [Legionella anisa]|nr:hypothetical protein [Legionella anisa]KTC73729.1 hypothetical protein Lani_0820 [Legionella anisa]MBN5937407.1 hypothetical protein [Legionella anisa]MCW8447999.1 hypothetical protein [Legionella anisa]UAK78627.1 hypothetical protein K8O89_13285 [Legionella anisa]
MPRYLHLNRNPIGEHFMEGSVFQFYDTVYVSETLIMMYNENHRVKVGDEGTDNFILTDSLRPCQGVIAKLTTGEFSIYHNMLGWEQCEAYLNFVESLEGKIEYIYVLQKDRPINNIKKAPCLAIELTKSLGVEVKRLHVNDHTFVIGDSENNRVILGKNIIYYQAGIYVMSKNLEDTQYDQYKNSYIFLTNTDPFSLFYINELGQKVAMVVDDEDLQNFKQVYTLISIKDESQPLQKVVDDQSLLKPLWEIITSNDGHFHCKDSTYVSTTEMVNSDAVSISTEQAISMNQSLMDLDNDMNGQYETVDGGDRYYPLCRMTIPRELLETYPPKQPEQMISHNPSI